MKKQIIIIHGGNPFNSYEDYFAFLKNKPVRFEQLRTQDWKITLGEKMGDDFDVIIPTMPCKENARYSEWKVWFERLIPFFEDEVSFIGHSLGGIFLVKWLSENSYPKQIKATFLVAAPYQVNGKGQNLTDFKHTNSLEKCVEQAGTMFIYHSEDDPVVTYTDAKIYKEKLPNAELQIFKDRKHFNNPDFPEIIETIKSMY
jgi:predicted alpha/beta hydrolase family esterase